MSFSISLPLAEITLRSMRTYMLGLGRVPHQVADPHRLELCSAEEPVERRLLHTSTFGGSEATGRHADRLWAHDLRFLEYHWSSRRPGRAGIPPAASFLQGTKAEGAEFGCRFHS